MVYSDTALFSIITPLSKEAPIWKFTHEDNSCNILFKYLHKSLNATSGDKPLIGTDSNYAPIQHNL